MFFVKKFVFKWRWDTRGRAFADGTFADGHLRTGHLQTGHLRMDICGRNVWKIEFFEKIWIFQTFRPQKSVRKSPSANVRQQMSVCKYPTAESNSIHYSIRHSSSVENFFRFFDSGKWLFYIETKIEKFSIFCLKIIFLGVILCKESIVRIPEAWKRFPDSGN